MYKDQLYGFWLGQSIANWTGLVTEMDKIGNIGEIKTGDFYVRNDWGKPDEPNIWSDTIPSELSHNIDFVFKDTNEIWGSDDDTDIEYIYQYLMYNQNTAILTAKQIREGWLNHIILEEENYLWVSNQKAFDLMLQGYEPPETSDTFLNEHTEMIDAQLTTEIFGLFAPARPDVAIRLAHLPIRTTANLDAAKIAEFYVIMYSLASITDTLASMESRIQCMAENARLVLPNNSYPAHMYDYVKEKFHSGITWEQARDSIYYRYQVSGKDGYDITSRELYCNGCFAAGINFAASLISLFYGKGNISETIKIGTLVGWDSDNPTATWGGLLGFMIGKKEIEKTFKRKFSNRFNIHRTRKNFPNNGIDTFENMADMGIKITDNVILNEMNGKISEKDNSWLIPVNASDKCTNININNAGK
ncbi:MAG: ADP-ribosylglycohydrolase family protein [Bacteroidales bacterium]|nr:ADP-ribosylglycohydrolase family protein [Bacteroidales bacterium]MDG2080624.1 ADP-ribosylglycohydrolase family protein [Bacteroidales bacterium]